MSDRAVAENGPDAGPGEGARPDAGRRVARTALLVTAALYLGYAGLRLLGDGLGLGLSFAAVLVAGFYFVPGYVLRDDPELAERWQVGPDLPIPPWRARGWKVAGATMLVIFPPFVLAFFWFYWRVCGGDATLLAPALWLEGLTPGRGSLEGFVGRLCARHPGGLWPPGLRLPEHWTAYGGAAALYWVALEIFVIALPEEVFHRGYLMSALEQRWPPTRKLLGVPFGWAAVLSSALFALGHLVGDARTDRLFTFFPSLLFAWLWRKSDSLWAPTLVHAASNLLMQILLASTFPGR